MFLFKNNSFCACSSKGEKPRKFSASAIRDQMCVLGQSLGSSTSVKGGQMHVLYADQFILLTLCVRVHVHVGDSSAG